MELGRRLRDAPRPGIRTLGIIPVAPAPRCCAWRRPRRCPEDSASPTLLLQPARQSPRAGLRQILRGVPAQQVGAPTSGRAAAALGRSKQRLV